MLITLSVRDFAAKLASSEPAPGGGSAAAVTGLLGISLLEMVISLTRGRAAYAAYDQFLAAKQEELANLHSKMEVLVDEDAAAFRQVMVALALPKSSEAERETRSAALQKALLTAAQVPLDIARVSVQALTIARDLLGKVNKQVISDLAVGAINCHSAVLNALINTAVNLPALKDQGAVNTMQTAVLDLKAAANSLLKVIQDDVYGSDTFAIMKEQG